MSIQKLVNKNCIKSIKERHQMKLEDRDQYGTHDQEFTAIRQKHGMQTPHNTIFHHRVQRKAELLDSRLELRGVRHLVQVVDHRHVRVWCGPRADWAVRARVLRAGRQKVQCQRLVGRGRPPARREACLQLRHARAVCCTRRVLQQLLTAQLEVRATPRCSGHTTHNTR